MNQALPEASIVFFLYFQTKSIKMQCKKDFFRIREIYPNLPVLCLTQHFTGPQIKNLKELWLGEPMPNFFTNPETAHPSKETQNISKLASFLSHPALLTGPQIKNLKVLWLGEPMPSFFHKFHRFGINKLL